MSAPDHCAYPVGTRVRIGTHQGTVHPAQPRVTVLIDGGEIAEVPALCVHLAEDQTPVGPVVDEANNALRELADENQRLRRRMAERDEVNQEWINYQRSVDEERHNVREGLAKALGLEDDERTGMPPHLDTLIGAVKNLRSEVVRPSAEWVPRAELRLEEENVEFAEKTLHLVLGCCDGEHDECRGLEPVYASVRAGEGAATAAQWKAAYEAKLADFARETLRTSRMLAACDRSAMPMHVVGEAILGYQYAQEAIRLAGQEAARPARPGCGHPDCVCCAYHSSCRDGCGNCGEPGTGSVADLEKENQA